MVQGLITRIVELPDLDGAFIEAVQQARVDAHLAEVLAKRLPMSSAAADRTVVDADHSVAPDICGGFSRNGHLVRRKICDPPRELPTERAIAIRNPLRLVRNLDPHVAAVTAAVNAHGDI